MQADRRRVRAVVRVLVRLRLRPQGEVRSKRAGCTHAQLPARAARATGADAFSFELKTINIQFQTPLAACCRKCGRGEGRDAAGQAPEPANFLDWSPLAGRQSVNIKR